MVLEEKQKISEVFEFLMLPYAQNRKLGNLEKYSFTSNFESCCNFRFRNDKNELRQKLKVIKRIKKNSEFSEFWIMQNRTLENLRKGSFTLNFYRDSAALLFSATFNIKSQLFLRISL